MWIIWPLLYSPPVEVCVVCHKMIVMTLMMTWVCTSVQSWRGAYDLHGRTLHMCIYELRIRIHTSRVYIYIPVAYTLTYESRIHLRMSRMAELLPSALSLSLMQLLIYPLLLSYPLSIIIVIHIWSILLQAFVAQTLLFPLRPSDTPATRGYVKAVLPWWTIDEFPPMVFLDV